MIRRLEVKDLGEAKRLMEGLSINLELLGCDFPHPDKSHRQNAYVNTILQGMFAPEEAKNNILLIVAEQENQVYSFLMAHVHVNYEYARHQKQAYVAAFWTEPDNSIPHVKRGRDILEGLQTFLAWKQEVGATSFFGNAYFKDEISRKLMRRLKMKPTFIRYEGV